MLKIRDDVDLKELEKFGFQYGYDCTYIWENRYDVKCIIIDCNTREIVNYGDKNANIVLYDLIQAGLVEKV